MCMINTSPLYYLEVKRGIVFFEFCNNCIQKNTMDGDNKEMLEYKG